VHTKKPLSALDEYNAKLFESTERLAKRCLELKEVRARLDRHSDDLRTLLRKYDEQARKHYKDSQSELVETALREKLRHQNELDNLKNSMREMDGHIISLESHKKRLQGQLQLADIKKESLELRYDATKAELETRELQQGLSQEEIPDVKSAIDEAEDEIRQIQIQLEAVREIDSSQKDSQFLADSSNQREIEEEIERLKDGLIDKRERRE
jgi:phage shock protein A